VPSTDVKLIIPAYFSESTHECRVVSIASIFSGVKPTPVKDLAKSVARKTSAKDLNIRNNSIINTC
jgi:hypothetical protein